MDDWNELQVKLNKRSYFEASMHSLTNSHMVIERIGDAYELIDKYVLIRNEDERKYCQEKLKEFYYSGYKRYDEERL